MDFKSSVYLKLHMKFCMCTKYFSSPHSPPPPEKGHGFLSSDSPKIHDERQVKEELVFEFPKQM